MEAKDREIHALKVGEEVIAMLKDSHFSLSKTNDELTKSLQIQKEMYED